MPVRLFHSRGEPEDYPLILPIMSNLDVEQLAADYYFLRDKLSKSYITDREKDMGVANAKAILHSSGFLPNTYVSQGLMKKGTCELLDIIPQYTRHVLESLPSRAYRVRYSTAKPGWTSTYHGDAHHFRETGFRFNLPITQPAFYSFKHNNETLNYKLDTGTAWFINFCRIHQGYNPSDEDRICLIFQLDSDLWINDKIQSTSINTK